MKPYQWFLPLNNISAGYIMVITRQYYTIILTALMTFGLWVGHFSSVQAEDILVSSTSTLDMPAASTNDNAEEIDANYPILNITQDKSEMVKLEQEAASVIVGNPNHISVLLDTPNTLIVVPRTAGASHFTVIGKDGSILMQRHVIVGAPKEKYVRIRRSCGANDSRCQKTSTYFCPDTCHEVQENSASGSRRR